MKPLILLPLLALCGCGSITRAEYENANPHLRPHPDYVKPNGDVLVAYPDLNPRMDFAGNYTCQRGVRVVTYRDGVIVSRFFQTDQEMPR